ncbi:hypothetical protein PAXRUDRAFT_137108, partial [Paxillus rubicundulus Ve08.2h10]
LTVLRNDYLPLHIVSDSYDFALYKRAILYPKGMQSTTSLTPLEICSCCRGSLLRMKPLQLTWALANFQHYGHQHLPVDITEAFKGALPFDLMLISKCQSSMSLKWVSVKGL